MAPPALPSLEEDPRELKTAILEGINNIEKAPPPKIEPNILKPDPAAILSSNVSSSALAHRDIDDSFIPPPSRDVKSARDFVEELIKIESPSSPSLNSPATETASTALSDLAIQAQKAAATLSRIEPPVLESPIPINSPNLPTPQMPEMNFDGFAAGGKVGFKNFLDKGLSGAEKMKQGINMRDTVPAMLTPGEFVIRKEAVDKIGLNTLENLNQNGDVNILGANRGGEILSKARGGQVRRKRRRGLDSVRDITQSTSALAASMAGSQLGAKASGVFDNRNEKDDPPERPRLTRADTDKIGGSPSYMGESINFSREGPEALNLSSLALRKDPKQEEMRQYHLDLAAYEDRKQNEKTNAKLQKKISIATSLVQIGVSKVIGDLSQPIIDAGKSIVGGGKKLYNRWKGKRYLNKQGIKYDKPKFNKFGEKTGGDQYTGPSGSALVNHLNEGKTSWEEIGENTSFLGGKNAAFDDYSKHLAMENMLPRRTSSTDFYSSKGLSPGEQKRHFVSPTQPDPSKGNISSYSPSEQKRFINYLEATKTPAQMRRLMKSQGYEQKTNFFGQKKWEPDSSRNRSGRKMKTWTRTVNSGGLIEGFDKGGAVGQVGSQRAMTDRLFDEERGAEITYGQDISEKLPTINETVRDFRQDYESPKVDALKTLGRFEGGEAVNSAMNLKPIGRFEGGEAVNPAMNLKPMGRFEGGEAVNPAMDLSNLISRFKGGETSDPSTNLKPMGRFEGGEAVNPAMDLSNLISRFKGGETSDPSTNLKPMGRFEGGEAVNPAMDLSNLISRFKGGETSDPSTNLKPIGRFEGGEAVNPAMDLSNLISRFKGGETSDPSTNLKPIGRFEGGEAVNPAMHSKPMGRSEGFAAGGAVGQVDNKRAMTDRLFNEERGGEITYGQDISEKMPTINETVRDFRQDYESPKVDALKTLGRFEGGDTIDPAMNLSNLISRFKGGDTIDPSTNPKLIGRFKGGEAVNPAMNLKPMGRFQGGDTIDPSTNPKPIGRFEGGEMVNPAMNLKPMGRFQGGDTIDPSTNPKPIGRFEGGEMVNPAMNLKPMGRFQGGDTIDPSTNPKPIGRFEGGEMVNPAMNLKPMGRFEGGEAVNPAMNLSNLISRFKGGDTSPPSLLGRFNGGSMKPQMNEMQVDGINKGGDISLNVNDALLSKLTSAKGYQRGGEIEGLSGDNNIIKAADGEFIINEKSVREINKESPGLLDDLNSKRYNKNLLQGYAKGGYVGETETPTDRKPLEETTNLQNDQTNTQNSFTENAENNVASETSENITNNISININMDGKGNAEAEVSSEDSKQNAADMAKKIKDAVMQVIRDEKRTGGELS